MPLFPKLGFKKKQKKQIQLDEKTLSVIIERELALHKNDLVETLKAIENDKAKLRLWNSLPKLKKLELLRYVARKRGLDAKK
jgi:Mg/Co/Ni transporter MgtE